MSGMMAVFWKELADYFSSKRFIILSLLVYVAGIITILLAAQNIRTMASGGTSSVFILLFLSAPGEFLRFFIERLSLFVSPFTFLFMLLIPFIGISFGIDSINSERTSGNLSRLLSQPIYRDAVINGKFLAGLIAMSILIASIVVLVAGMGLRMIGVPPTADEILRLFAFMLVSIIYGAFWMSLAVLFSVLFRNTTTSVLISVVLWIFFFVFSFFNIGQYIAGLIVPVGQSPGIDTLSQFETTYRLISRVSPFYLYGEAVQILLMPFITTANIATMLAGSVGTVNALSLGRSLLIVWPQLTSLIGLTALCFAISYIKFMREEIRAT
jgi:ABC-2 type transport system permease protein